MKKTANTKAARAPGRPKISAFPRAEQLRLAKRAQRERDRADGFALCQLKLTRETAERLRQAAGIPGFQDAIECFLDESVVDIRKFPNLGMLCWNRAGNLITDRDAFGLYERNWRFVDTKNLDPEEQDLIRRLTDKYGNGVLNV